MLLPAEEGMVSDVSCIFLPEIITTVFIVQWLGRV